MKSQRAAALLGRAHLRPLLVACFPPRGILGLNYHRIGDGSHSNLDRGLWSASEESFDQQLAFLKKNCDVISPADIDTARKDRRGLHVLITFDDGYLDNYQIAFAALRRHGLPATFFIATGFIDDPRLPWWDEIAGLVRSSQREVIDLGNWLPRPLAIAGEHREQSIHRLLDTYKSLPAVDAEKFLDNLRAVAVDPVRGSSDHLWMNWDMVREMAANGMTIGGHTIDHVILSSVDKQRQWEEISGCAARIEQEIGKPMEYFAYPVGGRHTFNDDSKDCLRRAGVRYAFSYYGGFTRADAEVDPYDMPRVPIEPYVDRDWFRAIVQLPRLFCRPEPAP